MIVLCAWCCNHYKSAWLELICTIRIGDHIWVDHEGSTVMYTMSVAPKSEWKTWQSRAKWKLPPSGKTNATDMFWEYHPWITYTIHIKWRRCMTAGVIGEPRPKTSPRSASNMLNIRILHKAVLQTKIQQSMVVPRLRAISHMIIKRQFFWRDLPINYALVGQQRVKCSIGWCRTTSSKTTTGADPARRRDMKRKLEMTLLPAFKFKPKKNTKQTKKFPRQKSSH